jgi:hypothetical protein
MDDDTVPTTAAHGAADEFENVISQLPQDDR